MSGKQIGIVNVDFAINDNYFQPRTLSKNYPIIEDNKIIGEL